MVVQVDGERLELQYSDETTTPATTAEYLQLLQSIISHPSSKAATIHSITSLVLAQTATTVKAIEQKNSTLKQETNNTGAK
jgi:hypothetical protein